MAHKKEKSDFTIQGLIVPVAWDEEGNPLSVAVSTFDEEEYIVEKDIKGKQLFGLLREEVEVTGVVANKEGVKTIKIGKYVINKKSESIESISR